MCKYEYTVISRVFVNASRKDIKEFLDSRGEHGWELCSHEVEYLPARQNRVEEITFYFRRCLTQELTRRDDDLT